MAETLIASGGVLDFSRLSQYESRFNEGDEGHLIVSLRTGLPSAVVSGIDSAIKRAGGTLTRSSYQSDNQLHIHAKKQFGFLAIIAVAVAAAIVMIALVLSWKLMKLSPAAVVTSVSVWLILIVVGLIVALKLFKIGGAT